MPQIRLVTAKKGAPAFVETSKTRTGAVADLRQGGNRSGSLAVLLRHFFQHRERQKQQQKIEKSVRRYIK
jgi:hypothetical protein